MSQGKGFLLCYAITNRDSFDEVKALHEQVLMTKDSDHVPMVLVGTKCDLDVSISFFFLFERRMFV